MKTLRDEPLEKRKALVWAHFERTLQHARDLGFVPKLQHSRGLMELKRERLVLEVLPLVLGLLLFSAIGLSAGQVSYEIRTPSPTPGVTNYVYKAEKLSGTNVVATLHVNTGLSLTNTFSLSAGDWRLSVYAEQDLVLSDPYDLGIVTVPEPPTNARTVAVQRLVNLTSTNRMEIFTLTILP